MGTDYSITFTVFLFKIESLFLEIGVLSTMMLVRCVDANREMKPKVNQGIKHLDSEPKTKAEHDAVAEMCVLKVMPLQCAQDWMKQFFVKAHDHFMSQL